MVKLSFDTSNYTLFYNCNLHLNLASSFCTIVKSIIRILILFMHVLDILQGYNSYFQDLNLTADEVFKNIDIFSPQSVEEFIEIIDTLKDHIKKIRDNKKVRLLIVDSLSMPILCCIDDPLKRPYYYSRILYKLNKLTLNNDIAIVITNEMIMQVDMDGKSYLTAAGGQYVADYAFVKLESTRLINNKFGIRLLKSPIMPELSETFMITEAGIRAS